ncbi:MAG: hypothetical protein QOD94_277 [Alphaproteobacteria bacterium]|nr:hypothetical protein [Alphaproteobacteria bacterium]
MLEYQLSQQRMQNALSSDAPRIYLNGFGITATLGDIMILLEANGKPVGVLNMSYTVATTLAARLGALINTFQERTGRPMLTIDAVAELLGRDQEQNTTPAEPAAVPRGRNGARHKPRRANQQQQRAPVQ